MGDVKFKKPKLIFGISSDLIQSYIKFAEEKNFEQLVIEERGVKITIKRERKEESSPSKIIPVSSAAKPTEQLQLKFNKKDETEEPGQKQEETSSNDEEKYHKITSPLVGTFYRAPAPGAPPFVNEGDTVSPGQTLCIVEAMKVMNKITSDINGKIVKIIPENAQPVKQGDVLFLIEPL